MLLNLHYICDPFMNEINPEVLLSLKKNQLIRSFDSVIKAYPSVKNMEKNKAVEYLLTLENEGKIIISFETINYQILCKIDWVS